MTTALLPESPPSRFVGRVAVVAGGTGALGTAVTHALLAEGATVVVPHRHAAEFDALRQGSAGAADRLHGVTPDLADAAAVKAMFDSLGARHGGVDTLVITVGAWAGGAPLWQAADDELERMLSANLRAAHALCRAALPAMLAQRRGAIVNVAAKTALAPPANAAAYAASKAGVLATMASLAAELRGSGVRVNSVLPNIIDTPANRRAMPAAETSAWVLPEDIARVILFLCSDDARAVHGAQVVVEGNA
jgi:NAD(P)-dependent dehydrogenase (short-subunit alcohol dehydrogenase family)